MKRASGLLFLLLTSSIPFAQSQYVLITASNITDLAGNKLASGTITFTPVLTAGSTSPAQLHLASGGHGIVTPVMFNVIDGVISPIYGVAQLVDVTQAMP